MDLFAVILVTITAITICGICLFIFVCALQPKILRKLHGTSADIGDDDDGAVSNQSQDDDDQRSVKSLDLEANQSDGETNGRNKKEFLKDLEKSLRTGRPIHVDENNVESNSYPDPSNFFYRWIRKYIR